MQHGQDNYGGPAYAAPQKRRGMPWWGWMLIVLVVLVVLPCFGCLSWVGYIGAVGPDIGVYTGNNVPRSYTETAKDVGALEPDEKIVYFYSDALTDIRNGFYFVSDRRVVIYSEYANGDALTSVGFDEINGLTLSRDTSFINDSQIYLELNDGTMLSFPVSSENDGDERFFEAIKKHVPAPGE